VPPQSNEAVREYLNALDDAAFGAASKVEPKFTSHSDPCSQWTAARKGPAFFAYPASEKLAIIRTVEGSHLPAKRTLDMLGIPRTTFYRWYDRYVEGGLDALADRSPRPKSVWNRIPQDKRDDLIEFAFEHEALTTRELAVKYTDEKRNFVSESSAYRILKAADLIAAPDYVVIKAADEFTDKTTAINEMLLSGM